MKNYLLLGYILVLICQVFGRFIGLGSIAVFTKPMIIPILLVYVFQYHQRTKFLYLALLLAWIGDLFLMGSGDIYFIIGLTAFLLSHICYSWIFCKDYAGFYPLGSIGITLLIIFSLSYGFWLIPYSGVMKVPIIIYMLVITGMGIMSILRNSGLNGYFQVVLGALLFIISDALLAFHLFYQPHSTISALVMLTYMLAQWLLITGFLKRNQENRKKDIKIA